jgi:hypothetical protein
LTVPELQVSSGKAKEKQSNIPFSAFETSPSNEGDGRVSGSGRLELEERGRGTVAAENRPVSVQWITAKSKERTNPLEEGCGASGGREPRLLHER